MFLKIYNEYNKLNNTVKTPSYYERYNKEYKLSLQNTLTPKNLNQEETKIE